MTDGKHTVDEMHRRVAWLTQADVRILEFLDAARDVRGRPAIQSPAIIAANTGLSRNHVGNRCRHLHDHGLLERLDRGRYRLSTTGEQLVSGNVRPEDL